MMHKLLEFTNKELVIILENTAVKLNLPKAIIEKDMWVCLTLKYLF